MTVETQERIVYNKKVCLLGDFAVGKTSLVRRFIYNRFDDNYISTIGVKVSRKTVVLSHNDSIVELTMMLWDLAGGKEFGSVTASYLRGAAGAILVCDMTRPDTLAPLQRYVTELNKAAPTPPLVLAANKIDLVDQLQVTQRQIAELALALNAPYYFTSAREGNEVDTLFRHLGTLLIERN